MDKFVQRKKRKAPDADSEPECYKNSMSKTIKLSDKVKWRKISAENLDCDYTILYSKSEADQLMGKCAELLEYNTGQLARVQIFGKWHDIPRKQVYTQTQYILVLHIT